MKKRSFYSLTLLSVLVFALIPRGARAQATPTATATPPPVGCVINQGQLLPNGLIADCHTGGTAPSSLLGISGGNINSITIDKTGNVACCSGTFGALVVDASPGATPTPPYGYVLSTNHTLARTSGPKAAKAKEEIVQPGLADLGCWQDQTDTVAELTKWTKISFAGAKNELDAAIAKVVLTPVTPGGPLVPGIDQTGFIKNIGQISTTPFPWANLVDNMPVMKMGRTSCLSTGVIAAFDAIGLVSYDATCNAASSGVATFDHQILVLGEDFPTQTSCSFAAKGDSGAIVLTNDFTCPEAIGMVFAGVSGAGPDSGGTLVAVNPMTTTANIIGVPPGLGVLDKLKVSLVGQTCTPSAFEQRLNNGMASGPISPALRTSIEAVRSVKKAKGHHLLKKKGVVAVGIGSGDNHESAALAVYLTDDTPALRNWVQKQVKGTTVKFKVVSAKFKAL